jgi:hypothetical protein
VEVPAFSELVPENNLVSLLLFVFYWLAAVTEALRFTGNKSPSAFYSSLRLPLALIYSVCYEYRESSISGYLDAWLFLLFSVCRIDILSILEFVLVTESWVKVLGVLLIDIGVLIKDSFLKPAWLLSGVRGGFLISILTLDSSKFGYLNFWLLRSRLISGLSVLSYMVAVLLWVLTDWKP